MKKRFVTGKDICFIMGKNCVQEVLKHCPKRLISLFTSKKESHDPLILLAKNCSIEIRLRSKEELGDLVGSDSHQGYVAQVKKYPENDLKKALSLENEGRSLYVMLDSIFDPQNFGALIRASHCFGAKGVIYSYNRGCGITPVAAKASVGATELMPHFKVANLAQSTKIFKDNGYWIVTAEIGAEAQNLHMFEFPDKTLLILGSEGKGVQKLLSKQADFKVYIPMCGKIDSLNVSQALSVFLSSWQMQKKS